jgi:lysophospholipase L1-like esterase
VFDFRIHFLSFCAHENPRFRLQTPGQRSGGSKAIPYRFHNHVEEENPVIRKFLVAATAALLLVSSLAHAEIPWTFSNNTRYLAMGDSLAAGEGAIPVTQGYAYLLYQGGTFDTITNTIFADAAVPGTTSDVVLADQVPQAAIFFKVPPGAPEFKQVVTISVGGNDLLQILGGADPETVLKAFRANLTSILVTLRAGLPNALIIIGNQYDIPEITGGPSGAAFQVILHFNEIITSVAQDPQTKVNVRVADVFDAFQGRNGLLLIERHGAGASEVHPTNAGYRVMADAFAAAAAQ